MTRAIRWEQASKSKQAGSSRRGQGDDGKSK